MEPGLFGRGSWAFIFYILYFFIDDLKKIDNYIKKNDEFDFKLSSVNLKIEDTDDNDTDNTKINNFIKSLDKDGKDEIVLFLKEKIFDLVEKKITTLLYSLPCSTCIEHSIKNLEKNKNNVFESRDFLNVFHFFLELRNSFYENQIDRKLFDSYQDVIENKIFLFKKIISG